MKTNTKTLRQFGMLTAVVFLSIGLWPIIFKTGGLKIWSSAIAALLTAVAILRPHLLGLPYRGWLFLGRIVGLISSRIILSLLFYFLFTPIALARRMLRHDPLKLKYDPLSNTYRVQMKTYKPEQMERQF